jgi:hypothetical protein
MEYMTSAVVRVALKEYGEGVVEALFREVWHTIVEILGMLLELRLPAGVYLEWQGWNDPGPRWPKRFRWQLGTRPVTT